VSDVAIASDAAKTRTQTGWLKIFLFNLPYLHAKA
jgi:hypothetical protein